MGRLLDWYGRAKDAIELVWAVLLLSGLSGVFAGWGQRSVAVGFISFLAVGVALLAALPAVDDGLRTLGWKALPADCPKVMPVRVAESESGEWIGEALLLKNEGGNSARNVHIDCDRLPTAEVSFNTDIQTLGVNEINGVPIHIYPDADDLGDRPLELRLIDVLSRDRRFAVAATVRYRDNANKWYETVLGLQVDTMQASGVRAEFIRHRGIKKPGGFDVLD